MNSDLEVRESIIVNTTVEKLWDVLINPDLVKEYLYGTHVSSDWEVGSEIVFEGEYSGHKYRDHGRIIENTLHQKISYTYWTGFSGLVDKPENYALITYEIEELKAGELKFSWIQKGFSSEENYNHSLNATKGLIAQIKEIAERQ